MTTPFSLKTKIMTPRFEETRDWYRDLFSLELREEWSEPFDRGCILGFPGGDEAFLEIYYSPSEADYGGLSLQFRVEDVDRFSVSRANSLAYRGPEERQWGSRYLFFDDPNGISVIVFSGSSL